MSDISIDSSTLLSWFQSRSGVGSGLGVSGATATPTPSSAPVAPWTRGSTAPQASDLVKRVLSGASFVDPGAAKLTVQGRTATESANYKDLFALYQGLSALKGLADQAAAGTASSFTAQSLAHAFARGLQQVQSFLAANPFRGFDVEQGSVAKTVSAAATTPAETDTYQTGTVYQGDPNAAVPAFAGNPAFTLTVTNSKGVQTQVEFDLAELNGAPPTMANVVNYMNAKLKDAGLVSRVSLVRTAGPSEVLGTGKNAVVLPSKGDLFAFKISSSPNEKLAFSAPDARPALYLTLGSGVASGTKADQTQQLVKLDSAAAAGAKPTEVTELGAGVRAVRASVRGPDGGLWVLADVQGTAPDGQAVQGAGDVALLKCDSTGKLVASHELGAANTASGYALAVSPDGASVAVAGQVTGGLDPAQPPSSTTSRDGFVAVFDAQGSPKWTARTGSGSAVTPGALSFAADGSLYLAGSTASPSGVGSSTFLQRYTASGALAFTQAVASGGANRVAGLVQDGSRLTLAGVENGHAVLRQYALQPSGAPSLTATRDLGDLQGGDVAGLSALSDGTLVLAGTTHNGALNVGASANALAGASAGFVAEVAPDLTSRAADALAYLGDGATDRTVSALTVANDRIYVAGQTKGDPALGSGQSFSQTAYASEVDPVTGAVAFTQTARGRDGLAAPTTIAVDPKGASVLDAFGLPSGTIDYAKPAALDATTPVRAGQDFYVRVGSGAAVKVAIEPGETLATLAIKLKRASGFNLSAQVTTLGGASRLTLTPGSGQHVELIAGEPGRDALKALGLSEGLIAQDGATGVPAKPASAKPTDSLKSYYALGLPSNLSLDTTAEAKQAQAALSAAMTQVQGIYQDMTTAPKTASSAASGTVPAYLTNEIASYQAAPARLTGGA